MKGNGEGCDFFCDQDLLNYAGGIIREDFMKCFSEDRIWEIKCHLMICTGCSEKVEVLSAQLRDQLPWFKDEK